MNRVAIILGPNGEFTDMVADTEIEFYIVQPSCERDRVYQFSSGQFGPQHVQATLAGSAIGHMGDGMLYGDGDYGKRPPSRPKLSVVPPSPSEASR